MTGDPWHLCQYMFQLFSGILFLLTDDFSPGYSPAQGIVHVMIRTDCFSRLDGHSSLNSYRKHPPETADVLTTEMHLVFPDDTGSLMQFLCCSYTSQGD